MNILIKKGAARGFIHGVGKVRPTLVAASIITVAATFAKVKEA